MSFLLPNVPSKSGNQLVTVAVGCFWGAEKFFYKEFQHAIVADSVAVGYTGGNTESPSYEQVCSGSTGHAEAFRFEFDPSKESYSNIIKFFFRMHDSTTLNRQGNDVGSQYRSAIFYHSQEQKEIAEKVKNDCQSMSFFQGRSIVTEIVPATKFWRAESYHQKYLEKNPSGYCNHRIRW